jgi:hypothetical protein
MGYGVAYKSHAPRDMPRDQLENYWLELASFWHELATFRPWNSHRN